MSFAHVPQWKRHLAVVGVDVNGAVNVQCAHCQLVLPPMTKLNSIVLTKEDRCYVGDDPRAVNCV